MSATAAKPALKYPPVRNYIGGRFVPAKASMLEVLNPSDGAPLSQVPLSSGTELDAAVRAAAEALPAWSARTIKDRVQVFYRYRSLLERDFASLSALVS
jgi:malonate-semialdehyde dehydrogenase (acetylating)/methylmalonate-semialdehyde dehydrogenase